MVSRYSSICASCAHLRFGPEGGSCIAFPHGVPDEIGFGGFDHRHPYPGDNGIQWMFKLGFQNALRMYGDGEINRVRSRRRSFKVIEGGRSSSMLSGLMLAYDLVEDH